MEKLGFKNGNFIHVLQVQYKHVFYWIMQIFLNHYVNLWARRLVVSDFRSEINTSSSAPNYVQS